MKRVSLPMYNLPEMRPANAAFWMAIRTELHRRGVADVPAELDFDRKPVPPAIGPEVLFTQVCGWPLQTIYAGQAVMLGTPVYHAPFCQGGSHAGVFVVHAQSTYESVRALRGCRFVFNSVQSNSGMNLPRRLIADLVPGGAFFASVVQTHSQPGNLECVARQEADATCVDCVTYAFFARARPEIARNLRVLAPTPPSPAIPFATSAATPPDLRAALTEALLAVARSPQWASARAGLLLADIVRAEPAAYRIQCDYAREAAELGYPHLV
jgi:ABC-type phosphate/phosphonate transport system substrate-binding protein